MVNHHQTTKLCWLFPCILSKAKFTYLLTYYHAFPSTYLLTHHPTRNPSISKGVVALGGSGCTGYINEWTALAVSARVWHGRCHFCGMLEIHVGHLVKTHAVVFLVHIFVHLPHLDRQFVGHHVSWMIFFPLNQDADKNRAPGCLGMFRVYVRDGL